MTSCEIRIMVTVFVSRDLDYVMYSAMDSMQVGCFEHTGCLITMLPNDLHNYNIKSQEMTVGSFTVNKVAANDEANSEEDEYIDPMNREASALDEELISINN